MTSDVIIVVIALIATAFAITLARGHRDVAVVPQATRRRERKRR